ncbi:MAG: hypothetical protein OZSIB_2327 [Candidatus Ozemobacter sibiricus]|uniref:Uncharacterized protein n=1 Tax=Candidatus Ozemobacter sibiricus TaxID=2268124 RepID=A0A367ZSD6_9BACT|nr:MAG: hypothetical protein OZSIB_2327 [Candidatus Ozemobacter sibiricus]
MRCKAQGSPSPLAHPASAVHWVRPEGWRTASTTSGKMYKFETSARGSRSPGNHRAGSDRLGRSGRGPYRERSRRCSPRLDFDGPARMPLPPGNDRPSHGDRLPDLGLEFGHDASVPPANEGKDFLACLQNQDLAAQPALPPVAVADPTDHAGSFYLPAGEGDHPHPRPDGGRAGRHIGGHRRRDLAASDARPQAPPEHEQEASSHDSVRPEHRRESMDDR